MRPSIRPSSSAGSARALRLRERLFDKPCYRLVHAEADGLPGLVIDRFADVLVCQLNSAGMAALESELLGALERLLAPRTVVLRNDSPVRELEGLPVEVRVVKGELAPPIELEENGLTFLADPLEGQKTGWYFDQTRKPRVRRRAFAAASGCSTCMATARASAWSRRPPGRAPC